MKEIIYLDTELMNSMLAQLDEGLINSFVLEHLNQEVETSGQQTTRGKGAGFSGNVSVGTGALPGGKLGFGANIGNTGNESTNESTSFLESEKDILNKAFHDYALEILISKLKQINELTEEKSNLKQGDLLLVDSKYKFYDFELISKLMDTDKLAKIMMGGITEEELEDSRKLLKKTTPKASEADKYKRAQEMIDTYEGNLPAIQGIKQMELVSKYFSNALGGLSLFKASNLLGLMKKEHLREYPEAISLRTDKSRKVKLFVRVIGKKQTEVNFTNLDDLEIDQLDTIPNIVFDGLLGTLRIFNIGDILVSPIAVYYE
jgi:hypothetical protein